MNVQPIRLFLKIYSQFGSFSECTIKRLLIKWNIPEIIVIYTICFASLCFVYLTSCYFQYITTRDCRKYTEQNYFSSYVRLQWLENWPRPVSTTIPAFSPIHGSGFNLTHLAHNRSESRTLRLARFPSDIAQRAPESTNLDWFAWFIFISTVIFASNIAGRGEGNCLIYYWVEIVAVT